MNLIRKISVERIRLKVALARILALMFGIIVLKLAMDLNLSISFAGFPDGHITDYDRATRIPLTICDWIWVAFAFYYFYLGFIASKNRLVTKLFIATVMYLLVFAFTEYGIEYYYKVHSGLDYGQGG